MIKSLKIPIGVDSTGGTKTVSSDDRKRQLISIALSSGDSLNAFQQDINLGMGMIFGKDGTDLRSSVLRRLYAIFDQFEVDKLFQLMRETIQWNSNNEGELTLNFYYIDIETDSQQFFAKNFTVNG